jgi:hypothetical protein
LSGMAAPGSRTRDIAARSVVHAVAGGNLIMNGKFRYSTAGWRTKGNRSQRLTWKKPGRKSHGAARLKSTTGRKVILDDTVNTVTSTRNGQVVKGTVCVRVEKSDPSRSPAPGRGRRRQPGRGRQDAIQAQHGLDACDPVLPGDQARILARPKRPRPARRQAPGNVCWRHQVGGHVRW